MLSAVGTSPQKVIPFQSKDPVSISTTPVTLCWNSSLSVTIHLLEPAALPPLNVECTKFGDVASHCYQHWGAEKAVFQQMCPKL